MVIERQPEKMLNMPDNARRRGRSVLGFRLVKRRARN